MNLIESVYCEWVEDLGLSPIEILTVLLEKEKEKVADLQKRLSKYENN